MFTWDPVKARSNAIKHGVSFEAVWDFAWERAVVVDRTRQGDGEPRRAAIRRIHGALHTIVFTERPEGVRIIGVRCANRAEERAHARIVDET